MEYKFKVNDPNDLKEFYQSGLLWFCNTVIHPFGFAVAVSFDETDINRESPIGLMISRTTDPEGMIFSEEDNLDGTRKFSKWINKF